jgi:hypothetical protein
MNERAVQQVIIEVLTEIQTKSGRPLIALNGQTRPIGGLSGFDSLNAVEATVELAGRLHCDMAEVNVFLNSEGTRPLCIQEITDRLCGLLNREVATDGR